MVSMAFTGQKFNAAIPAGMFAWKVPAGYKNFAPYFADNIRFCLWAAARFSSRLEFVPIIRKSVSVDFVIRRK